MLSANEPTLPDMRNVWSTVKRPALRLTVTSVAAMRSSFCFRTCGDNVLAVSDRCEHCLAHGWAQCTNAEASPYQAGPKVAKTRSDRTVISTERVKLARAVAPAEVIALESATLRASRFGLRSPRVPPSCTAVRRRPRTRTLSGRISVGFVPGGYYTRNPPKCITSSKEEQNSFAQETKFGFCFI